MTDSRPTPAQTKRIRLNPDMFDSTVLSDEVNLEIAVGIIESHLATFAVDKTHLVSQLFDQLGLLEYIVSVLSQEAYERFEELALTLPTAAKEFGRSFAHTLLKHLSNYFATNPLSSGADRHVRAIEFAPQALETLAAFCDACEQLRACEEDDGRAKIKGKKMSQSAAKRAKRVAKLPLVNTAVLREVEIDEEPKSSEHASVLITRILEGQQSILKSYLATLRQACFAAAIKDAYIPQTSTGVRSGSADRDTVQVAASEASNTTAAIREALSLESAEGFGEWRVFLPQRAQKDLRVYNKRSPPLYNIIMKKLCELSHGFFSPDNQKRLDGVDSGIPVYEAKMTGDTRLVYRFHCLQEIESNVESQVIWVYGVYTHAELHGKRFWDAIAQKTSDAGSEYRKRCKPQRSRGGAAVSPMSWPPTQAGVERDEVDLPDLSIKDNQELQALLTSEKFAPFTQDLLLSIVHDADVAPLFQTSPEEQAIVLHAGSCFVVGRGGTGKTTTGMIRMVAIERMWRSRQHAGGMVRPRQIFVTQSAILAQKVQEYYEKMTAFFEARVPAGGHSSGEDRETLDPSQPSGLYDHDEEEEYREDLPTKFSELTEDHFPLFLPFHRLCRLLEADLVERDQDVARRIHKTYGGGRDDYATSSDYMLQQRSSFISYTTFLEIYWNHFPENLTKRLDPFLVFAEFMGIIKGSETALRSKTGWIDRARYINADYGGAAPKNSKDAIYTLFELYTKRKTLRSEYDAADRTRTLVQCIRREGVTPGTKVDYVYVDEVQDNLLADTEILRTICRRPDGMFWAGDTAQTISAGSSFRLNELKAFMFRLEGETNAHRPGYFHLNRNFRSHSGIVKAAQTVIDVITRFWPNTIDILEEEKGLIDGPKPLFIGGAGNLQVPHFEQFMGTVSDTPIEFGAQQCILVRDDAARDQLRRKFGDVGVILTPYESKGQEFEDVLIYNPFADSPVSAAQWRVLLNCYPVSRQAFPAYDDLKHHALCFELKSLYVAMTRARSNLWIVDYSAKGECMQMLWSYGHQIDVWVPGTAIPRLTQSSSPDQWAKTAEELFHKKNYRESALAYARAGNKYRVHRAVAEAFVLRNTARAANARAGNDAAAAYTQAAGAFRSVAEENTADQKRYMRMAAECYTLARDLRSAAKCYELAALYSDAAKSYRQAGSFDDAVRLVKTHDVEPFLAQKVVDVAALFYLRGREISKAVSLLGSPEEAMEYAEDYGLDAVRATLLEESKQYTQAIVLHMDNGDLSRAVSLLCSRQPVDHRCLERVQDHIVKQFWSFTTLLDTPFDTSDARFQSLNSFALKLAKLSASAAQNMELAVLPTLASQERDRLLQLGIGLLDSGSEAAGLYCLDQAFMQDPLRIAPTPLAEAPSAIQSRLDQFLLYAKVLEGLVRAPDLADNLVLHKLLAVRPTSTGIYQIRSDSLLCATDELRATRQRQRPPSAGPLPVDRRTLERVSRHALGKHLLLRGKTMLEECKDCKVFTVCWQYSLEGRCNFGATCRRAHLAGYDHRAYRLRVSLHTTAICIYQTVNGIEAWPIRQEQQRYWLIRLKETLYPPSTKLGSSLDVYEGINGEVGWIISAWLADSLLTTRRNPGFFLNDLFRFCFLAKFVAGSYFPPSVYRASCLSSSDDGWLLRGKERVDVVQDCLRFFTKAPLALTSGILMARHIIEKKLPIEVGLLCDLMDTLCGTLVIARRIKHGGSAHTLLFPGIWFQRLQDVFDGSCPDDIKLGWMHLESVKVLLEDLRTQSEHLRFGTRDPKFIMQAAYIARLCRNICILGYNLRNEVLRHQVLQIVTSMKLPYGRDEFPWLYRSYVHAQRWEDLVRVLWRSILGDSGDRFVELVDASRPAPSVLRYVTRVTYRQLADIPALLNHHLLTGPSITRPQLHATNDPEPSIETDTPSSVHSVPDDHPGEAFDAEAEGIEPAGEEDVEDTVFTNVQEVVPYAEDDLEKVRRAVLVYLNARASSSRRKPPSSLSLLFAREVKTYLAITTALRGFRLKATLWAFPHFVIGLRGILRNLRTQKTTIKRQLADQKTDHLKLDDLMAKMTSYNAHIKTNDRLVKAVEPDGEIHTLPQDSYIAALSRLAQDVERFITDPTLPTEVLNDWRDAVNVGISGARLQQGPITRHKKPELVLDELTDCDYICM